MQIVERAGCAQRIIMTSSRETADVGFWDRMWLAMGKPVDSPEVKELVDYAQGIDHAPAEERGDES